MNFHKRPTTLTSRVNQILVKLQSAMLGLKGVLRAKVAAALEYA